jgi:hypothetical protein
MSQSQYSRPLSEDLCGLVASFLVTKPLVRTSYLVNLVDFVAHQERFAHTMNELWWKFVLENWRRTTTGNELIVNLQVSFLPRGL